MNTPGTRARGRVGPLLIALAAGAGLYWSWGAWPDATIDFGRELYVPWRLSQGDVLYGDIVAFNGPFSHYLLTGWFAIGGASLLWLAVLNAAVLGGTLTLVYVMIARVADAVAATLACLTFVGVFAFGHLAPADMVPMGNFNWIAPYSHELTHGVGLVLLSLYCAHRFACGARARWLAGAGLALGCAFLTKAEVFAAGLGASAIGLCATFWLERTSAPRAVRSLALWAAGAVAPVLASVLLLTAAMPWDDALRGTLGTWPYVLDTAHTRLPYFQWGMGLDDPATNVAGAVFWLAVYAAVFAPVIGFGLRAESVARKATVGVFCGASGLLAVAWLDLGWITWFDGGGLLQWHGLARPWPLLLILVGGAFVGPIGRRRVPPAERPAAALRIALIAFALLLLAKMILNVRVFHYGFALAAPAACIVVAFFSCWLPEWIQRRGGDGSLVRAMFAAVWIVTLAAHLTHAGGNLDAKDHVVGSGTDSFRAGPRGKILSQALGYLAQHAEPDATLAALPEGIMLNYLLRKKTTTPFLQYTPPLIALYGEDRMVAALDSSPPDWIALVHRVDADYGAPFFGRDYGRALRAWITRHYTRVARFGDRPFRDDRFGIVIMKRRV